MPILRWISFLAGLMLASFTPVSAAWMPLGGPVQPVITLQLDPGRPELLYARVLASANPREEYLWRSEDAGATWRDVQAGLEHSLTALAIDPSNPQVIWVWTHDGQLWRSADAGDTWSQRFATPSDQIPPDVIQLLVDPHHPDTLYRVENINVQTVVAVSRDGGASFTRGSSELGLFIVNPVYVHPGRGELVTFVQSGLEVSTDGGQTWSLHSRYQNAGFLGGRLAPSAPDTFYALIPNNPTRCLVRSDDAGAHWRPLAYLPRLTSGQSACTDLAIDPRDARHLWVAAVADQQNRRMSLLFESHDGGTSWSRPLSAPSDGVVAAGGEVIYTSSNRGLGLYVSQDGGHTWKRTDQGIAAGDLRDGFVAQRLPAGGRRLFALHTPIGDSPDAVYRSDGGRDWVKLPLQQPAALADAGGSDVLAVDQRGVIRSSDGGNNWQVVTSAPQGVTGFRSNVTQPRDVALVAFEDNGSYGSAPLWTSDDGGATWRRSSRGLPIVCTHIASVDTCPDFTAYAVDPFNPSRRWVVSIDVYPAQPSLYVSEDAGVSWHLATVLPYALALVADPQVQNRLLAGTYSGLFASTDGGQSWLPLGDLPAGAVIHQFAFDARSAAWYVATVAHGIYRSLDGGAHWTLLAGAPDHNSPAIAVDPRRPTALLAAFRGQGIWRWTP